MTFEELYNLLEQKKLANPDESNSAMYLALGSSAIGKKVLEAPAESWMAAEFESKENTCAEIAQLLYWTALLAVSANISLEELQNEL